MLGAKPGARWGIIRETGTSRLTVWDKNFTLWDIAQFSADAHWARAPIRKTYTKLRQATAEVPQRFPRTVLQT
jgi:hypothetical protein